MEISEIDSQGWETKMSTGNLGFDVRNERGSVVSAEDQQLADEYVRMYT